MKWTLATRTASLPEERWSRKISEWNPGLDSGVKTNRPVGRPKKRWEDEINDFVKEEETEETKGNDQKNNDTWIHQAKKLEEWKKKEEEFAKQNSQRKAAAARVLGFDEFKQFEEKSTLHLPTPLSQM